ncbi:MAG: hypothetical protein M3347_13150, partial [Armatimonadota bacterium]|nr:hypothetical protein [Armatimonadota bacterium]
MANPTGTSGGFPMQPFSTSPFSTSPSPTSRQLRPRPLRSALAVAPLLCCLALCTPARAVSYGTNVIVNPNAEAGPGSPTGGP